MPAGGRRIGHILSLGFPLPGPAVDNYNFLTAPAFFDYDTVVVDPAALSRLIEAMLAGEAEAATFAGRRVRNAPEAADDVALADALLRRRHETDAALDAGALVVCFAEPPRTHHGIAGVHALDDYYWLRAPEGLAYGEPQLVPCEGTRGHVVDYTHPLAAFVGGQLANLAYHARFETSRIPGFAGRGRVFVRSEGGAAIGVDLPEGRGRIVFLPALARVPQGEARYAASDALQAGIRRALGVMAEGRPPAWVAKRPLPGLDERAAALEQARRARDASQAALAEAERAHDELARYQRLLWQEGALGLDDVVLDALRLIGFEVYAQDRSALELRAEGASVLLEIEASERSVDLAPHYRLRQRIEDAIAKRGAAPRGLLVVNGCRLQAPEERREEVSGELRLAAETLRYAIAPSSGLYEAVRQKLGGDDEAVAAYRLRLVTETGLLA